MSASVHARIDRYGPEIVSLSDTLHMIYLAAFSVEPYREGPDAAARWRDDTLPRHAARGDFRCAVARVDGVAVGFAYGYTGERGQPWTDWLSATVPSDISTDWVGGHFEFVELAVAPVHQRRGIGTALHDALLAGLSHRVALLTTMRADTPARRLYLRRGWRVLVDDLDGNTSLLGKGLGKQRHAVG